MIHKWGDDRQRSYRKCPKCGLNYITDAETFCSVCVSASKPYRGKYCRECGVKSGMYECCWSCHKIRNLSGNERQVVSGYRTDNGMLGTRSNNVCEICGTVTYGKLCGRCYMSIHYGQEESKD